MIEHVFELPDQHGVIMVADILEGLSHLEDNSVAAIVTDPPYELNFMGKGWDNAGVSFQRETWEACLRVLKPGGHMVVFGGTRTHHRMWCAIEDAGFEVRDMLTWMYGTGFPKSLDVSKAIDKAAGAEREVVGKRPSPRREGTVETDKWRYRDGDIAVTAPATDAAKQWEGYGTALKPAVEPILLARKPLSEPTVAANVLKWGVGGLNINDTRIGTTKDVPASPRRAAQGTAYGDLSQDPGTGEGWDPNTGRWPANVMLDEDAAEMLGGVSRFFYCPKASRAEREHGLEDFEPVTGAEAVNRKPDTAGLKSPRAGAGRSAATVKNPHPTVKPIALMRWLIRLVMPPTDIVLDPFCGSGSTLIAAVQENYKFIGVDSNQDYGTLAYERVKKVGNLAS